MSLTPSITDLAYQIQENARVVEDFLSANSIPPLSFAADALPFFPGTGPIGLDPFPAPPPKVLEARLAVQQACDTLLRLVTPPAEHTLMFVSHYHSTACLQYVYRFKIAEAVPLDRSITYSDLASSTGLPELQMIRILRSLITHGYFHEPTPNSVAHTVHSKLLLVMRDSVWWFVEEGFPSASLISTASEKFGDSEERNHTAWNLAHKIDQPIFEYLETDQERRTRFMGHMRTAGSSDGWNIKHLVRGYDWSTIGTGTVVDIGGSIGHSSYAIADAAPELIFVVQDLEQCIESAKAQAQTHGKGSERLKFTVHDFFTPQVIKGAEVYLLRFILHDYPDKYAVKILQQIVPALGENSRIIVMDCVAPDPGVLTKVQERMIR